MRRPFARESNKLQPVRTIRRASSAGFERNRIHRKGMTPQAGQKTAWTTSGLVLPSPRRNCYDRPAWTMKIVAFSDGGPVSAWAENAMAVAPATSAIREA